MVPDAALLAAKDNSTNNSRSNSTDDFVLQQYQFSSTNLLNVVVVSRSSKSAYELSVQLSILESSQRASLKSYQLPIIIGFVVLLLIYSIYLYARYRRKTSLHAYQEWSDTGGVDG